MLELKLKANITQVIEIHNHETNENSFLYEKDGEWIEITEEEYNQIRGIQ